MKGEPAGRKWWDVSWNPVTGCSPVSAGCDRCYARAMARRLVGMGEPHYAGVFGDGPGWDGFGVRVHTDRIEWAGRAGFGRKPRRVFVCSMSDLFHERVSWSVVQAVLLIAAIHERHTFLILTKRARRMAEFFRARREAGPPFPRNVWVGVTAENDLMAKKRIPHLLTIVEAPVRWVSLEPLLGPVDLVAWITRPGGLRHGIDWAVVGGETGPNARPMRAEWVAPIVALRPALPVWFKQWGGRGRRPATVNGEAVMDLPKGRDV